MGDHFSVDVSELAEFSTILQKARDALDEVRKSMHDASPGGIGTRDLDDACNEFQEHWRYGSEQIAEQTEKLADTVKQSKANYEEIERSLEQAFQQAAPQGDGP